jgi:chromosome partition protein MukF
MLFVSEWLYLIVNTLNEILAGFLASGFEINVSNSQLALLLLIYYRLTATESQPQDFSDSDLLNSFQLIDRLETKDPNGATLRGRLAVSALERSGIIVRSDCGGLSAVEPVYSLTALGRAIAEHLTRNLQFDKDTLKAILNEAIVRLSEVSEKAQSASTVEEWRQFVTVPLREFVGGAFERILRYQANLDLQHEKVREEIFQLVQSKAEQAIDPCAVLLERSMQTITDLRDSLLENLNKTDELALAILVLARDAEAKEAMESAEIILKRTAQISEWTRSRVEAWSLHYQNVHSFLRYVVRVDPNRQIAEGLKNAIRSFDLHTQCLAICRERRIEHFNDQFLQRPPERPTRSREDFVLQPLEAEVGLAVQLAADIEKVIEGRLNARGQANLADVLREVEDPRWQDLHVATGMLMQHLFKVYEVSLTTNRNWTAIRGDAEIQDIHLEK